MSPSKHCTCDKAPKDSAESKVLPLKAEQAGQIYAKDLMSQYVFTLYLDDTLDTLNEIMRWRHIRHVPVIDDANRLVGLVTHRDLLRSAVSSLADISESEKHSLAKNIRVRDIMTKEVLTTKPETLIKEVAKIMFERKIGCLPVVEENCLVGIITEADFVRYFLK